MIPSLPVRDTRDAVPLKLLKLMGGGQAMTRRQGTAPADPGNVSPGAVTFNNLNDTKKEG